MEVIPPAALAHTVISRPASWHLRVSEITSSFDMLQAVISRKITTIERGKMNPFLIDRLHAAQCGYDGGSSP